MEKWENFLPPLAFPGRAYRDGDLTGWGVPGGSEDHDTRERRTTLWPQTDILESRRSGVWGSLVFFLAGKDRFYGNVSVKAWREKHIPWLILQLLKCKCRRFLCTNAKPFPVSLTVSLKITTVEAGTRSDTVRQCHRRAVASVPFEWEVPWPDLWVKGNFLLLDMTVIIQMVPNHGLGPWCPFPSPVLHRIAQEVRVRAWPPAPPVPDTRFL